MCRLVPFWLHILDVEGIAPIAVLVLRSPGEVARSLAARNDFEAEIALLIWLRHVLDAEATPGLFVEDLCNTRTCWRAGARLPSGCRRISDCSGLPKRLLTRTKSIDS